MKALFSILCLLLSRIMIEAISLAQERIGFFYGDISPGIFYSLWRYHIRGLMAFFLVLQVWVIESLQGFVY